MNCAPTVKDMFTRLMIVLGAIALLAGLAVAPAHSAEPAGDESPVVWYRCKSQPITWGLYIQPGTKLSKATERRFIKRALDMVTSASGGVYTFSYVPITGTPQVVWDTYKPIEWQMMAPTYVSTPKVDVLFMITGKGQPTIEIQNGKWPFQPKQPFHSSRRGGLYLNTGAPYPVYFLARAAGYFEASKMAKSSVRTRKSAYVWAAAGAVGATTARISYTLPSTVRSEISVLGKISCNSVATYPNAYPAE